MLSLLIIPINKVKFLQIMKLLSVFRKKCVKMFKNFSLLY